LAPNVSSNNPYAVRMAVKTMIKRAEVGVLALTVGSRDFFEMCHGPAAQLIPDLCPNTFFRMQSHEWLERFFRNDRYGSY
jgi:hypothetical protein